MRILREFAKRPELLYFVVSCIIAFGLGVGAYFIYNWGKYAVSYCYHNYILDDAHDMYNHSTWIGKDYRFYENGGHSYIREIRTNQKVLKDISWIAGARDYEDSLLCFAKGGFRGFFNKKTGQVDIPADRYRKAWLFSEGLAAVMEQDSSMVFIDTSGKKIIEPKVRFSSRAEGHSFLFNKGYCALVGPEGSWGLLDHSGNWAVKPQFDDILPAGNGFWIVEKDGMMLDMFGDKEGLLPRRQKTKSVTLLCEKPHWVVLVIEQVVVALESDILVGERDMTRVFAFDIETLALHIAGDGLGVGAGIEVVVATLTMLRLRETTGQRRSLHDIGGQRKACFHQ